MAMEGVIQSRDGKLRVMHTYCDYHEPVRVYVSWTITATRATGYGERPAEGDLLTHVGNGEWQARNPETQRSTGAVFTEREGHVTRVIEPAPPSRGKGLRWRDGRWERLMARGWTAVTQGVR